jgi:hypothetical protein
MSRAAEASGVVVPMPTLGAVWAQVASGNTSRTIREKAFIQRVEM